VLSKQEPSGVVGGGGDDLKRFRRTFAARKRPWRVDGGKAGLSGSRPGNRSTFQPEGDRAFRKKRRRKVEGRQASVENACQLQGREAREQSLKDQGLLACVFFRKKKPGGTGQRISPWGGGQRRHKGGLVLQAYANSQKETARGEGFDHLTSGGVPETAIGK